MTVNIYAGSHVTGTPIQTLAAADDARSWNATASHPLAPGTYTAQAQQTDLSDNLGLSDSHTFRVRAAFEHSGKITKTTVREHANGRVTIAIHNPNSVTAMATVKLTKKTVEIGHGNVRLPAHRNVVVTLRLSKHARAYLRKHKSLRVKATIVLTAQHTSKTRSQAITITAPKA